MTSTQRRTTTLRQVVVWTALIAAVWVVVGFIRTDTTLHLGPLLVPLMPVFLLDTRHDAVVGTITGAGFSMAAIALLEVSGNLEGPALGPFPGALPESLIVLAAAVAIGLVAAVTMRPEGAATA